MDWIIDAGISALLRIVNSRQDRKKWAKALAKVFVAIRNASDEDPTLKAALVAKALESDRNKSQ